VFAKRIIPDLQYLYQILNSKVMFYCRTQQLQMYSIDLAHNIQFKKKCRLGHVATFESLCVCETYYT